MNSDEAVHPHLDDLKAFGLGRLAPGSAEIIQAHIELCGDCRRVVESAGNGSLGRSCGIPFDATPLPGRRLAHPVPVSSNGAIPPELAACRQYEDIQPLGEGGMGIVFRARNTLLDRLEVLKVVGKNLQPQNGAAERFLQEIQAAARLQHPNVVAAYSALQLGELLVFSMEYVPGNELGKLVTDSGPLPLKNAAYYAQQVADGLQHAHECGMIHRDIKPANLILHVDQKRKRHVVKILDFGLAKVSSECGFEGGLTGEGRLLGTPDYIAPEQSLDAQSASIRADIYSLGCTIYFLLTGRPPFIASNLNDLLRQHREVAAPPLNQVRPDVPVELAAVVARMMAKDPGDRFATPAEVAKALAPFVASGCLPPVDPPGEPTTVRPPLPVRETAAKAAAQTQSPRVRRPRWMALLAACGLAGVILAVVLASGALEPTPDSGAIVEKKPPEDDGPRRERPQADRPPPADESISLFDGKTLNGWNLEGPRTTTLLINDGILIAANNGANGYVDHLVANRKDFQDGIFRCEFQKNTLEDAVGIMLRVDPSPVVFGGMRGYLIQVESSGEVLLSLGSRVRIRYILANSQPQDIEIGRWHQLEAKIVGKRIVLKLNGSEVIDYEDQGDTFPQGRFALQFRTGKNARYRRIDFTECARSKVPPQPGDPRTRWTCQALTGNQFNEVWAVFTPTSQGEWIKSITDVNGFRRYVFKETARTEDYIELERDEGDHKQVVRLHDRHTEYGPSRDHLVIGREGGWR